MSQDEDLTAVRSGNEAVRLLQALETLYIGPRRDELLKQADQAIEAEKLTPELSVQILTQLHEHKRVAKQLNKLVKCGEQASARINSPVVKAV